MTQKNILYLVHRIPFPPNKGDKIRSYNILKSLAESHTVYLGAFVDDPHDWRHAEAVREYCAETCLLGLNPRVRKFRSLRGLVTGTALTIPYYAHPAMRRWVQRVIAEKKIHRVLVFSSAMAQYVETEDSLARVIDFVDVDADKWRQYAERKSWPASWIYRREADCLLAYDRNIARNFDRSLFVSEREAALFAELAPESASRVMALENGVDTVFFNPGEIFANPYPEAGSILVFTGAMDYWANIDAVTWFAAEIFPEIRRRLPDALFYIVGARPTEAVRALGRIDGVQVTGGVKDIRPYLQHAHLAMAPLRIARGVQNKVLEAMAMAKPVIATAAAMDGIAAEGALDVVIAGSREEWVQAAVARLSGANGVGVSVRNRAFVESRYGWARNLARLGAVLESL